MRVRDFLKKPPVALHAEATVEEAVAQMAAHNIGAVVIVDTEGRPLGIITERDVLRAIAKKTPLTAKALEVGTARDLVVAKMDDDIYEAMEKMRERKVRHLIVVDDLGKVAGVLSIRDLLEDRALKSLGDRVWWPKPEE
ncbi:MAG: CBS domain-containing protein [Pyrobaculum sp.]